MIDEKLLLKALELREEKHNADYETFADLPEAQVVVGHCLQELQEIREIIEKQPKIDWIPYPYTTPRNGQICLVAVEHKGGWITREVAMFFFGVFLWNGKRKRKIVAWQPMPEYRGAENEHE